MAQIYNQLRTLVMALIDEALREMAFTEDEAKILLKKRFGGEKIQTLEDEIKATKQALGL